MRRPLTVVAALLGTCAAAYAPSSSSSRWRRAYTTRCASARCCEAPSDSGDEDLAQPASASANVKASLLLNAARAERGFKLRGQRALADMRQQVELLESLNPTVAPVDSPLLVGDWELEFTDAFDVLSLALSPLEVGPIQQNVVATDTPGTLAAENVVEFLPPGASLLAAAGVSLPVNVRGSHRTIRALVCFPTTSTTTLAPQPGTEYVIGADCQRQSATRVGLVFARVRVRPLGLPEGFPALAGGLPQPAVEQLQRLTENAVYLETTYLDEEVRVARGPGKEIYVLSRR